MSVERINGRWQFRVVGRFVDESTLRVTGAAPKHDNTQAAALRVQSEAIAWMVTQPRPAALRPEVNSLAIKKLRALVADAEAAAAAAHAAANPAPTAADAPTLATFWDTYQALTRLDVKPSSMYSKEGIARRHLVPRLGHLRLDQITYAVIEDLKVVLSKTVARRRKGRALSNKTINNVLVVLGHMLETARLRDLIVTVPRIKCLKSAPPSFRFLSEREADRLVDGAEGEWRTMIFVALRTGMRLGELCALQWEDVDLDTGCLHVRRNFVRGVFGTPKSGKSREIGLGDDVITVFRRHRHERGSLVFCDAGGHPFTKSLVERPLRRACKVAGIKPLGWHVLRHTFASDLVRRGVHLRTVQELLGHATVQMTERYAHLQPEAKRDAVRLLDRGVKPWLSVVTESGGKELAKPAA